MAGKKKNDLDSAIEAAWYRLASGVQVSILDIPKIFSDVRLAASGGSSIDDAIGIAVAKYRQN